MELTKGNSTKSKAKVPFSWGQQQQEAFDELKRDLQEAQILVQFDRSRPILIETDASNQAISGVLSQGYPKSDNPASLDSNTGKLVWKLVDCHAKTLTEQQRNWPIHDKELWAIVSSLTKWRSWLSGLNFEVHTDHQGPQYFQTKQRLNARQARWQQDIAEFTFTIKYKPGSAMQKADALTRKTGDAKEGVESQLFPDGTLMLNSQLNSPTPGITRKLDNPGIVYALQAPPKLEKRLAQILALEQAIDRQNELQIEHTNDLTLKGQNEVPRKGQNEVPRQGQMSFLDNDKMRLP